MEKMMERMEGVARQVVPLFYILGLVTGTAYYFTDGGGDLAKYALSVGICLAVATELHSFLCQRRILVAWSTLKKAQDAASEEEAKRDLWMAGGWLVALLAFQIFAGIMYRATVWHPSTALLPAGPQIVIAGAVIPLFFFGVSFLSKVVTDPADVQAETKRTTAMKSAKAGQRVALRALDAATRSFNYRLRQAEKSHADLTGLAVSMQRRFADDDGAQTLMVIDAELRDVEGQTPRKYAGMWTDPDAAAKAARPAVPPLAQPTPPTVAPAQVPLARPDGLNSEGMSHAVLDAFIADQQRRVMDIEREYGGVPGARGAYTFPQTVQPDLLVMSDGDLRAYMQYLADVGRAAQRGETSVDSAAYIAEQQRIFAELARRGIALPQGTVPEGDDLPPPPVTRFGPEQRAAWEAALLGQGDGPTETL